jgi:hypothetical protein
MISPRQKIVLIVVVALIIIAEFVYIVISSQETPSQVMILKSSDLGPEWQATKPEKVTGQNPNASDSAVVRMQFNGSQIEGICILTIYPTMELANASYDDGYKGLAVDNTQRSGMTNITLGDRAVFVSYSSNDHDNWSRQVMMQKGTSMVWITLISEFGPGIETSQILALAELQAAKLP